MDVDEEGVRREVSVRNGEEILLITLRQWSCYNVQGGTDFT